MQRGNAGEEEMERKKTVVRERLKIKNEITEQRRG